ncbi:MAG: anti-sigma factor [Balneolaceae bacterium]|nr:anti-sigma factor [Balneolaceae bacterium]
MTNEEQHNDFEALCAGYVLDALTDRENRQFEEMLRDATPEQIQLFEDMMEIRDELALASEPTSPSLEVEENIMATITGEKEKSQPDEPDLKAGSTNIIPIWAYQAAAAIFLIASLTFAYVTFDLSETVDFQQSQITELQSQLDRQEQLLTVLSGREVTLVNMNGLDPSPEGYGKIIWDPDQGEAVLQLANLPAPPQDKDYQLWLIKAGQNPISAGVFNFERPSTDLFFRVEQLNEEPSEESNTFAVTLEPKGGVPQPTGDMFLLGEQQ